MFRIYSCLAHQHNLVLVVVAALICLSACFVAVAAFEHGVHDASRRRLFVGIAALVAGLGVWATHFVAMLAFEPGFPITYDLGRTALSIVIAVAVTGLGWTIALGRRPIMAPLGGATVGGGVAGMHYVGMTAMEVPGDFVWDHGLVALSVLLGVGLSALAVWIDRRRSRPSGELSWGAAIVLTLAICGLHFTAMAAAELHPRNTDGIGHGLVSSDALAIIVTAAALVIMAIGFGLLMFERRFDREQLEQAQHRAELAEEILRVAAERERLTAELERQVAITEAAIEHLPQGLSLYDADNRLVMCNSRYGALHGIPGHILKPGVPLAEVCQYLVDTGAIPEIPNLDAEEGTYDASWMNRHELYLPNGRIVEFHRRAMPDGGWLATHEDVTEARQASQQIAYLAAHDTLTGLPNRVTFAAHLDACARSGKPFALHTIDLDRFKEVNDTLGHPVGDHILKGTAARLRELVGKHDVVTRLGGDEFAVIQRDIEQSTGPGVLAARIVERLAEPFEFDGHTVAIGASVGICRSPEHGVQGDDLLKKSDLALYCAKEESRGTYRFFESGMDSRLSERRQLEVDLRAAISDGQFEVHYQPLLDMAKGRIGCFEALVRWRHPTRGLIQPAEFIATAEDSGLIIPIGEWVLRQACRDAAGWPGDVKVAVNLSPAQFKRGDLIAMTMNALTSAGLAPQRLELEITESVLLHDETWVHSVLDRLSALGVGIAMDDFGTGYSSLSYLRSFPFNKIKIDRSFIADLVGTSDALSIVQATIQLSQKLGMEITAEGVETAEQLQILAAEGCTQIQGYHVSQPIPLSKIDGLLNHYNPQPRKRAGAAG
jgi:diguanylate cyclase (GGDEF)-like protein